jgi:N-acetylmuramate 1-kinase
MIPQSEFRNPKYQDFIDFAREALGLTESVAIELSPLEGRGSDRIFYRLRWNQKDSAILIHYDPKRVENTFYADIAKFLHETRSPSTSANPPRSSQLSHRHGGPRRYGPLVSQECHLGHTTGTLPEDACYRAQTPFFPGKGLSSGRVRLMESFGPELYRWERDYFRNHFVRDVCGIELEPPFEQELEESFRVWQNGLLGAARSLVHRDLQSQNVMIRGENPFSSTFRECASEVPFMILVRSSAIPM